MTILQNKRLTKQGKIALLAGLANARLCLRRYASRKSPAK